MNSLRRSVGPRLIREATANPNRRGGGTQASCLAADVADRSTKDSGRDRRLAAGSDAL
jgi:hypothetical protein